MLVEEPTGMLFSVILLFYAVALEVTFIYSDLI